MQTSLFAVKAPFKFNRRATRQKMASPKENEPLPRVKESVVGIAVLVGPLLAGFLAAGFSITIPYRAAALLVLAAILFQTVVTHKKMRGTEN